MDGLGISDLVPEKDDSYLVCTRKPALPLPGTVLRELYQQISPGSYVIFFPNLP